MTKYLPLNRWLSRVTGTHLPLTFRLIEIILGDSLPASARRYPEWWANEKSCTGHVQCRSWLEAGFVTQEVNIAQQTLVFRRV